MVLASLRITHDYFNADADVCRAIAVKPTPQTVRRLRQHGMAVLARDDGFDLFASRRGADDPPLPPPPPEDRHRPEAGGTGTGRSSARPSPRAEPPFLFTMALRDLGFAQYTEMPADLLPGDPPLLWSSRDARRTDDGSGLITPDWRKTAADPTRVAAAARAPAGGGAEAERDAYARGWKQFGLFDLHLPSQPPGGSPVRSGLPPMAPASEPLVYEMRFTARRTVWRYIVAAREGQLAEDSLEIVDPAATNGAASHRAPFQRLADGRRLPDGRAAVAFVSRAAMPLRQRAERRFALRGLPVGGHMRQRTLVDPLPAPSPRSTVFDVAARSTPPTGRAAAPWSDIYVFV